MEIWLIQIDKKRLLWISQISLIISMKINWFNSEKCFCTDKSVKINWFKSEKYFFHLSIIEKVNRRFNQWKFDWSRLREYRPRTNIFHLFYYINQDHRFNKTKFSLINWNIRLIISNCNQTEDQCLNKGSSSTKN